MESNYTAVIVHSRYISHHITSHHMEKTEAGLTVEVNASALPLVWSRLFGPPNFQNLLQQNSSPVLCPPMFYNRWRPWSPPRSRTDFTESASLHFQCDGFQRRPDRRTDIRSRSPLLTEAVTLS